MTTRTFQTFESFFDHEYPEHASVLRANANGRPVQSSVLLAAEFARRVAERSFNAGCASANATAHRRAAEFELLEIHGRQAADAS